LRQSALGGLEAGRYEVRDPLRNRHYRMGSMGGPERTLLLGQPVLRPKRQFPAPLKFAVEPSGSSVSLPRRSRSANGMSAAVVVLDEDTNFSAVPSLAQEHYKPRREAKHIDPVSPPCGTIAIPDRWIDHGSHQR
jgi:hypothetical protein